jgi:hypothetical protein
VCADDFDAYKAEIGSACYAREARVIRNKKWSHVVTIDIIRHDPLTADVIIPSRIPHSRTSTTRDKDTGPDVIEPAAVIPPDAKVTEPVA